MATTTYRVYSLMDNTWHEGSEEWGYDFEATNDDGALHNALHIARANGQYEKEPFWAPFDGEFRKQQCGRELPDNVWWYEFEDESWVGFWLKRVEPLEMKYSGSSGVSYAVFYRGEEDTVGQAGEVSIDEYGIITHVKLGNTLRSGKQGVVEDVEMVPLNDTWIREEGVTRITFRVPRTLDFS